MMHIQSKDAVSERQELHNARSRIDHFVLLEPIGSGSMGEVYAAYDTHLDRKVAMKLVRPDSDPSELLEPRLLREAKTLAQVSHPNVVQVYAAGLHYGQLYIAMEFIHGTTLTEWFTTLENLPRKRRQQAILKMFVAAGRGLEAAHKSGLVHRDFKPDNVLVGDDGRPRVVDFGLARAISLDEMGRENESAEEPGADEPGPLDEELAGEVGADDDQVLSTDATHRLLLGADSTSAADATMRLGGNNSETGTSASASASGLTASAEDELRSLDLVDVKLTQANMLVGTPRYMSPEQMRCEPADGRSDQFSFCVSLYEALCGEWPFEGKTLTQMRRSVLGDQPRTPGGTVPSYVRYALMRGLARDPDKRFPDMAGLLKALDVNRRKRTRRGLITGGVIAVLALALLLVVSNRPEPKRPCATVNDDVARLWTDGRRATAQQVFAGSQYPNAALVWRNAESTIDGYLAKLKDIRTTACRATYVQQSRTPDLYNQQMICLEQGLARLSVLLDSIASMSQEEATKTAGDLGDIVSSLPEHAACEAATVLHGPPTAKGPETRKLVDDIRRELAAVEISERLGRLDEAANLAEAQVVRTRSLDYPPVRAEALYHAARVDASRGDADSVKQARAGLLDAVDLAESYRHDSLALAVWSALSALAIDHIRDRDRAEEWLRRAMAAVQRTGNNPGERARVLHLRGRFQHHLAHDYAAAVESLEQAIALIEEQSAQESWRLAVYLGDLANSLALLGRYEAAVENYQRALGILGALFGQANPHVARLQQDLGASLIERGEFDRAGEFLRAAIQSYRDSYGEEHVDLGRVYCNLAELEQRRGQLPMAREYALSCRQIYDRKLPENLTQRAHPEELMGVIESAAGNSEQALEHYRAASDILEQAQDRHHLRLAINEVNLAEVLVALGRFEPALGHLERAEQSLANMEVDSRLYLGYAHLVRGRALRAMGQLDWAITYLERSVQGLGANAPRERANALWELALALVERTPEYKKRAIELAREARELYREGKTGAAESNAIDNWLSTVE